MFYINQAQDSYNLVKEDILSIIHGLRGDNKIEITVT